MQRQGTAIDPLVAEVSALVAAECGNCAVTKGINPQSDLTQCQYDGFSGAVHVPPVDENDPIGGWLLITPAEPLVLLTGPKPCGDEGSGGGSGGTGEGGTGEGGPGGTGEGGSGGTGEGGSGGDGGGGTGEGGSGGGATGGSGAGVTEVPNPETAGDGAANP